MGSTNPRQSVFFIPGEGIDRTVISTEICKYLGSDAVVRLGTYNDPKTRQTQEGYYVTAYRPLTSEMLAQLRGDSAKWQEDIKKNAKKNPGYANPREPPDFYINKYNFSDFSDASVPSQDYYAKPAPLQQPYYSMPSAPSQSGYGNYLPKSDLYDSTYSQPADQRPAPMRSQSDPVRSGGGNIRDIRLIHPTTGQSRNAAALLDTGCTTDNWVSGQTVAALGADGLINRNAPIKTLRAANMGNVQSRGAINLDWRWLPKGVKVNTSTFNVADATHYDVIIGNEFLEEKGLLKWVEDAFAPMIEHDPVISPYESEDMRQARERQQQEKANREAAKERDANRRAGRNERRRYK